MRASYRHGFTLIELSIVLVIIGLIVGGILVGRELIHAAELRGDIREIDKMDAAVNTFRLKYNCLPGDCANATQFLEGAYNGNGNGLIDTGYTGDLDGGFTDGAFIGYEIAYAIDDLARANVIAVTPFEANDIGVPTETENVMPRLPYGHAFIVLPEVVRIPGVGAGFALTGKHTYRLGTSHGDLGDPASAVDTIPARYMSSDAYWIDSKIDDGKAASGRVTPGSNADSIGSCFEPISSYIVRDGDCSLGPGGVTTACEYDLTLTDKLVGLFVQASF
jgi:prepilin-type N-terminal cleavage/methylation domain-containing protein